MKTCFLFLIALIFTHFAVFAQKGDGSIEGVIIDSSTRSPLLGASVELITLGQNRLRVQLTDKSGFFSFDSLDNGFYQLSVSFSGFRRYRM
ncbi:MAG: carboxypeptidase-like regulatory domain-containing protein, partial [Bacteroidota bacterium]